MKHILQMSATMSALAEPKRLQIVDLLRESPRPVGEIAGRLGLHQPQVSKHLRVLNDAGLVEFRRAAQTRIYRLNAKPLMALDSWLGRYRGMWKRERSAKADKAAKAGNGKRGG